MIDKTTIDHEMSILDDAIPILTRVWHADPSDPKLEIIELLKAHRAAIELYVIGGLEQPTGTDLAYTLRLEALAKRIAKKMADEKPELSAALVPDRTPANVAEAVYIMAVNAVTILSEIAHEMKTKLVRGYKREHA